MNCASDIGSNGCSRSEADAGKVWFAAGLRFECRRCGGCCSGEPGFVWVTERELSRIAEFLSLSPQQVRARFLRQVGGRLSLRERANLDCVFLERPLMRCAIYPVRPAQCRTWPFWPSNIRTPADWQQTCRICPGAGRGPVVAAEQVLRLARETPI